MWNALPSAWPTAIIQSVEAPIFFFMKNSETSVEAIIVIHLLGNKGPAGDDGREDGMKGNNDVKCKTVTPCLVTCWEKKSYFSQSILLSNAKQILTWKLSIMCSVVFIGLLLDCKTLTPIL